MEQELLLKLKTALGERVIEARAECGWVIAEVGANDWEQCALLARDSLGMDYLASLTAVDQMEHLLLIVHLFSLEPLARLSLRCKLVRSNPLAPTLSHIWKAADWHEREAAELFGISFDGHPNLVPLLLPEGWEGHPLRKDYVVAD